MVGVSQLVLAPAGPFSPRGLSSSKRPAWASSEGQHGKRARVEAESHLGPEVVNVTSATCYWSKQATRLAQIQGVGKCTSPLNGRSGKVALQRGIRQGWRNYLSYFCKKTYHNLSLEHNVPLSRPDPVCHIKYYSSPYLFIYKQIFIFLNLFIYLFIYGCVESSFLCEGFLQLRQAGATLHRGARASHRRGLSRCGAQAPDVQAQ